jgi:hypothetical protein
MRHMTSPAHYTTRSSIHKATRFWCSIGHNKTPTELKAAQPSTYSKPDKISTVAYTGERCAPTETHTQKSDRPSQSQNLPLPAHGYASAYCIADRSCNEHAACIARMGMGMRAHAHSSTSKLLVHKPNRLTEGHQANSNPIMAKL